MVESTKADETLPRHCRNALQMLASAEHALPPYFRVTRDEIAQASVRITTAALEGEAIEREARRIHQEYLMGSPTWSTDVPALLQRILGLTTS